MASRHSHRGPAKLRNLNRRHGLLTLLMLAAAAVVLLHGDKLAGLHGSTVPPAGDVLPVSVLVAMIGRDVAQNLPHVLGNIQRLAAYFEKEVHVVLVENNSEDGTQRVFQEWGNRFSRSRPPGMRTARLASFSVRAEKKDPRVLAMARNKYLELLGAEERYRSVDYLLAVDTDMCSPWRVERMAHVLRRLLPHASTEWDVLAANGVCGWFHRNVTMIDQNWDRALWPAAPPYAPGSASIYCDLLALRDTAGAEHYMKPVYGMVWLRPGTCDFSAMSNYSSATLECRVLGGQAVIPVQSAFGGWALYRADALRGPGACQHVVEELKDPALVACEHLSLHECLRSKRKARLVIATGLVVEWGGCDGGQQRR